MAKDYEGKVTFAKFNIDDGADIAGRYGVMGVPALFIFKNGEIIGTMQGFKPKDTLKEALDQILS